MCLTGNGATFTLTQIPAETDPVLPAGDTPPTTVGRLTRIGVMAEEVEDIEDNDLSTTSAEFCPGDIITDDRIPIGVVFDPDIHMPIGRQHLGKRYVGTFTFRLPEGKDTPASLTGSGYLARRETGDQQNNERTEGELMWRFDNKRVPIAFTASAAT